MALSIAASNTWSAKRYPKMSSSRAAARAVLYRPERTAERAARIVWKGTPEGARQRFSNTKLSPLMEVLSYPRSMTRQLERIVQSPLSARKDHINVAGFPLELEAEWSGEIGPVNLKRESLLWTQACIPVLYGVSWWNEATFKEIVAYPELPLGYNFEYKGIDVTRRFHYFFQLQSSVLGKKFFQNDMPKSDSFFGRQVTLYNRSRALCHLVEILPESLLHFTQE